MFKNSFISECKKERRIACTQPWLVLLFNRAGGVSNKNPQSQGASTAYSCHRPSHLHLSLPAAHIPRGSGNLALILLALSFVHIWSWHVSLGTRESREQGTGGERAGSKLTEEEVLEGRGRGREGQEKGTGSRRSWEL